MDKWEYKRRWAWSIFDEMGIMNEMGEDGWELCACWFVWLYFKRRISYF